MATKRKTSKAKTKAKRTTKRNTRNVPVDVFKEPKKAKAVSGDRNKLKKLAELKQVNKELDTRFTTSDKLFTKQRKLKEQLGIV